MPNQSKGARLQIKPASADRRAVWIIRDGEKRTSTGCGAQDRRGAEQVLRDYLADKHLPDRSQLDPASTPIADVLSLYASDHRGVARPRALGQRLRFLLGFWGTRTLATVNPTTCRRYTELRGEQAARRELEDLRAAIRHHWKLGYCDRETRVVLPPKSLPRERWLTRQEAAQLLRAARRARRPHVARFILAGLYTGTRAGALCAASFRREPGRGFVDVDSGVFYRLPMGEAQTNKRRPTIRIPPRLLAHMRRWRDHSAGSVVEFRGQPVKKVGKAFAHTADEAGVVGVTPHTLRHTAITWAMQNSADIYQAAGFFGVSPEIIARVYGHHHPDHQLGVGVAVTARPGQVRGRFMGTKGAETTKS